MWPLAAAALLRLGLSFLVLSYGRPVGRDLASSIRPITALMALILGTVAGG